MGICGWIIEITLREDLLRVIMTGIDRDHESGQYTETYPRDDFLTALEEHGPDVGTQEIADIVGCNRDTAYRRLRDLEEENEIESRKIGMVRLWSISNR